MDVVMDGVVREAKGVMDGLGGARIEEKTPCWR
jgi:hypothetical protein